MKWIIQGRVRCRGHKPSASRMWSLATWLVLGVLVSSCAPLHSESDSEDVTASPTEFAHLGTPNATPQGTDTSMPLANVQTEEMPVVTLTRPATPTPTVSPTMTGTPYPESRATAIVAPADMLISVIHVDNPGQEDEKYEVWIADSRTEEKNLVYSASPGVVLDSLKWGSIYPSTIFLTEIRGTGSGQITWQLLEISIDTGAVLQYFDEPQMGRPRLLDISAEGKWLHLSVEDLETYVQEQWFVSVEDGSTIVTSDYFPGFAWSPTDPDVFAYAVTSWGSDDSSMPPGLALRNVAGQEPFDFIENQRIQRGQTPALLWHINAPEKILVFSLGEIFSIDLNERQWSSIGDFEYFSDERIALSPSGMWIVVSGIDRVRFFPFDDLTGEPYELNDVIQDRHSFVGWYNDQEDLIVVVTEQQALSVLELGEDVALVSEFDLLAHGLRPSSFLAIAVQSIENSG